MFRVRTFLVVMAAAYFVGGCGPREAEVARVDGLPVSLQRVQAYVELETGSPWVEVDSRVASKLLDQLLEQLVLAVALGEAPGRGESSVSSQRSELVHRFVEEICGPVPTIPPVEIERIVTSRKATVVPDQVLIRQLLLKGLSEAQAARDRFEQGEDFGDLSRELSLAANADNGGLIGWVARGTQPEDVERELFSLDIGEVSRPVEAPAGYHLFQVLDFRPSGPLPEAEIASEVRQKLESAGSREHLSRCGDQAVGQADVVIYEENLWFDYRGRFAED